MFFRKFISNRNEKKKKVKMNKPVHLGVSILEISKTLMYGSWYDLYDCTKVSVQSKTMLHGYR